jgi:hypothetical protein
MPFSTEPGLILPGQRMMARTRKLVTACVLIRKRSPRRF